jgi:hypothetical protein
VETRLFRCYAKGIRSPSVRSAYKDYTIASVIDLPTSKLGLVGVQNQPIVASKTDTKWPPRGVDLVNTSEKGHRGDDSPSARRILARESIVASDLTERIRAASDILGVIGRYIDLRKVGTAFVGLWPFHRERTPSLTVYPSKQRWKCFGRTARTVLFFKCRFSNPSTSIIVRGGFLSNGRDGVSGDK